MFGWLKKKHDPGLAIPPDLPHRFEVIPGQLSVELHRSQEHDWVFVSRGMAAHGQREMVLCLRLPQATSLPREPLGLFRQCFEFAQKGQTVDDGDLTSLGPSNMFGRTDVTGLIYADCPPMEIPLPDRALLMLPLLGLEHEIRAQAGQLRILGQLGNQVRYYPFPYWFDPKRPHIALARQMLEGTLFNQMGRIALPEVRVWKEEQLVKIRIDLSDLPKVQAALASLPAEAPLALLTGLDWEADGCLVWSPGDGMPQAITPEGSLGRRLAGAFLLVCPSDESDECMRLMEDGFAFVLTPGHYATLLERLGAGLSFELRHLEVGLSLEWLSPRDYTCPDREGLEIALVRLYQPDPVLQERFADGIVSSAAYHQSLSRCLFDYFATHSLPVHGFLVVVGMKPGGATRVWIDDADSGYEHFFDLCRQLESVPPPRIEIGPVAFGFEVQVQGNRLEKLPELPRAWRPDNGRPWLVPDEVFQHLWP